MTSYLTTALPESFCTYEARALPLAAVWGKDLFEWTTFGPCCCIAPAFVLPAIDLVFPDFTLDTGLLATSFSADILETWILPSTILGRPALSGFDGFGIGPGASIVDLLDACTIFWLSVTWVRDAGLLGPPTSLSFFPTTLYFFVRPKLSGGHRQS